MGGSNSKQNMNILQTLCRGDIIKVEKPDGNKYYIYGGDWDKLYLLNDHSRDYFTINENTLDMDECEAVSFNDACGNSCCYKSSEVEWIKETKGTSLPAEEYNKQVQKTLLPGDIVKINYHNLLYIGNGIVVHLIGRKWCSSSKGLPKRHQKKLDDCPSARGLVAKDYFLKLGKSKKAYKANRSDLHGLPYKMIIKRALSQLGPAEFSLCGKNCQDFAYYMKYAFQVKNKIFSFALGKDPSTLCYNQENLEMTCMTEDIPCLDDGLSDESDDSEDYDWLDDAEDSDDRGLDEENEDVKSFKDIKLVVNHGDE